MEQLKIVNSSSGKAVARFYHKKNGDIFRRVTRDDYNAARFMRRAECFITVTKGDVTRFYNTVSSV